MISIDFSLAIALYTIFVLVAVLAVWMFAKMEEKKDQTLDPRFIWFCSVCTYTYINTKQDKISTCPRCGSYNRKEAEAVPKSS